MIHDMWQMLEQMGLVKQLDKDKIIKNAEESHESVESYLVKNKLITPQEMTKAYGLKYSLPLVEFITEEMIDLDILGKIQFNFLRQNVVMPIIFEQ